MIPSFPFFRPQMYYPYNRNPYYLQQNPMNINSHTSKSNPKKNCTDEYCTNNNDNSKANINKEEHVKTETPTDFFEIFGIHLYFDDILILCLLLFLYKENVNDQLLFLSLILLLMS